MSALASTSCDVFVAGCGMAGAAAALFAAKAGLSVVQAGSTAEIVFASGLFDVYDAADPWHAIDNLRQAKPHSSVQPHQHHPYAHMPPQLVRTAMEEFLSWLGAHGLPYRHDEGSCHVLTPMGALKRTWAVPETMWAGVEAARLKSPTLLVDFEGLREYSARQIAAIASKHWPQLMAARVAFPAPAAQPLLPGAMAQTLELAAHRKALADAIRPLLVQHSASTPITHLGLPAILGMAHASEALADLRQHLGVEVFEIPTLPASVPGMRLKNLFESQLDREGVSPRRMTRARSVQPKPQGSTSGFRIVLSGQDAEEEIWAKHVILATGRFIGRGLRAERDGIREQLMDLPVAQPENRELWHHNDLFDPAGHPVNRAGVMVDEHFHPIGHDGAIVHPHLYAVGTMLAHQDWMREKCGVGLAVATAKAAVLDITSPQKP